MLSKEFPERQFSEYLGVQQAALLLGVSPSTLRNWDRSGKLKASRHPFNGYRLYLRTDLEKVLQDVAQGVNKDAPTSF
jgi:predicted site-specific integrase-resolvase